MISLAADIGGTYSRLAWIDDTRAADEPAQSFRNADFASLEAVIEHGRTLRGGAATPIGHMVLALPGPVQRDPIALTNIDWVLQRDALRKRFGLKRLTIVNDFQAAALGALHAAPEDRSALNDAPAGAGPVVVAGAGTGLGMAWLPAASDDALPHATEGGHVDFAPNDEREAALLAWLAARYGHVSYERVLSGPGLVDLHRFVGAAEPADAPAAVVARADGGDPVALDAVRLFVAVLAAYAGNLALVFNPLGGIYLCGGVLAHLAGWLVPADFVDRFTAKGRMADIVGRIPVHLVTRHDTGLAGASYLLRKINGAGR
jgi:glucokinase